MSEHDQDRSPVSPVPNRTQTLHPAGVQATSYEADDFVEITQRGTCTIRLEKDVLLAMALEHCTIASEHPEIGRSRYRSADAMILEARAGRERAERALAACEATHLLTGDDEALLTDGLLTMESAIRLQMTTGEARGRTDPAGRDGAARVAAIDALLRKRGAR